MNDQNIIRVQKDKENPYVMIDKRLLTDQNLSWKAKGILSYLLSKPNNWTVMAVDLAKQSKDGTRSVYSGLKELEQAGYLERKKIRDDRGRISSWECVVYEVPRQPSTSTFCTCGKSTCGKQHTNNTEVTNTEITKNEVIKGIALTRVPIVLSDDHQEILDYYFWQYRRKTRKQHPQLSYECLEQIESGLFDVYDETLETSYNLSVDDLKLMIDKHFETRYASTDWNIMHFLSNGVKVRRMYEEAY